MHSFDDYYYFYLVVKHGGFSAASQASNITKSKLSRRILELEEAFNVTLIQRSTRHFKVTPLGQEFYEECAKVIEQADCAKNVLIKQKLEPQGLIKVSCPPVMLRYQVRKILNQFLKDYPKVEIELEITSRRVDLMHDDIDLAIRTNFGSNEDSSLIVRDIMTSTHTLVASPELLQGYTIRDINELNHFPTLVLGSKKNNYSWKLKNIHDGRTVEFPIQPRLKSSDLSGVYFATKDGLGIADLPLVTVENDLASGKLVQILPDWCSNLGTVQLVYASRKGQRLVLQKLIDTLVDGLRALAKETNGYLH